MPSPAGPRLPVWAWIAIVAGGALGYWGAGSLLLGARFGADAEILLRPGGLASAEPESIAPFVLLVVPAVLCALWTRESVRLVLRGMRAGQPPAVIAREVGLYALSVGFLLIAALFTSARGRRCTRTGRRSRRRIRSALRALQGPPYGSAQH